MGSNNRAVFVPWVAAAATPFVDRSMHNVRGARLCAEMDRGAGRVRVAFGETLRTVVTLFPAGIVPLQWMSTGQAQEIVDMKTHLVAHRMGDDVVALVEWSFAARYGDGGMWMGGLAVMERALTVVGFGLSKLKPDVDLVGWFTDCAVTGWDVAFDPDA
jgi:hypothetical protein